MRKDLREMAIAFAVIASILLLIGLAGRVEYNEDMALRARQYGYYQSK